MELRGGLAGVNFGVGLFTVCILSGALPAGQAQTPARIAKLEITGNKLYSAQQIVSSSGLAVGQQFSRKALNDAVNRLADTGAFEFARYNFHSDGCNVVVELVVKECARFRK